MERMIRCLWDGNLGVCIYLTLCESGNNFTSGAQIQKWFGVSSGEKRRANREPNGPFCLFCWFVRAILLFICRGFRSTRNVRLSLPFAHIFPRPFWLYHWCFVLLLQLVCGILCIECMYLLYEILSWLFRILDDNITSSTVFGYWKITFDLAFYLFLRTTYFT